MSIFPRGRLRRFWLDVHLWIGLGLGLLLAVVGVSGSLLVWHDALDLVLSPSRYAVTGEEVARPPSDYLRSAATALPVGVAPVSFRMPDRAGAPVRVIARGQSREGGGRPPVWSAWLDPPTARVLDAAEASGSIVGFLHVLHGSLAIPQYSGRQIVGWSGVAMLISAATGLYLWWPRRNDFRRALSWRPGFTVSHNLHRLLGFWICLPLAILSLTGIYLSFPQTGRAALSAIAPMSPPQQRPNFNAPQTPAALSPDAAAAAALAAAGGGATLANLSMPAGQSPAWRVQVRMAGSGEPSTVMVDDRSGAAKLAAGRGEPLSGDVAARWIRRIHDGADTGIVWQTVVFLGGVLPALFLVTGVTMWLRRRRARRAMARRRIAIPAAAE